MATDPGDVSQVGDRGLVEDVVKLLLSQAPPGWMQLHAEFEPTSQPVIATASVTMPDATEQPLTVSTEAFGALAEHQRRAAAAGAPWRRLVIDCHPDGRLSARTDPHMPGRRRWPQRVLAAITVGCLVAAAVVFAVAWRWGPPPRVGIIAESTPPRQAEAFAVIQQFVEAENRGDAAGMRRFVCADPTLALADWILAIEQNGYPDNISSPEAVLEFHDEGPRVSLVYALRVRPLSEEAKRQAAEKGAGGFYDNQYTLVEEDGGLKLCDTDNPPR